MDLKLLLWSVHNIHRCQVIMLYTLMLYYISIKLWGSGGAWEMQANHVPKAYRCRFKSGLFRSLSYLNCRTKPNIMTDKEEGTPIRSIKLLTLNKTCPGPGQAPGISSSMHPLQPFSLNGCPPFLENIHRPWPRKTHLVYDSWSSFHPAPFFWRFRKGFCLKINIIRKAEPGSVFFTQPAWGFRRAWNAINTNVKSAFVHYEVIQCHCYLTYKQLLPTNVNCHWDLELLYTREINLPFRLACYRILPSPAFDPSPQSGHV